MDSGWYITEYKTRLTAREYMEVVVDFLGVLWAEDDTFKEHPKTEAYKRRIERIMYKDWHIPGHKPLEHCKKHDKFWRQGDKFEKFGGDTCEECCLAGLNEIVSEPEESTK